MAYDVLVERIVALPPNRVYALLADFGDIKRRLPDVIESVEMRGSGIGSVRTIRLVGKPGTIEERLEALVENRLVSYSIINESPLPVDHYHAVVYLDDAQDGCRIRWGANWIARGVSDEQARQVLIATYNRSIDGIVRLGSQTES